MIDPLHFEHEIARLAEITQDILLDSGVRATMVTDGRGTVLASAGDLHGVDAAAIAGFVAGKCTSTEATEWRFTRPFDEGATRHYFATLVAGHAIFAVISDEIPSLTLARVRLRGFRAELVETVLAMVAQAEANGPGVLPSLA